MLFVLELVLVPVPVPVPVLVLVLLPLLLVMVLVAVTAGAGDGCAAVASDWVCFNKLNGFLEVQYAIIFWIYLCKNDDSCISNIVDKDVRLKN